MFDFVRSHRSWMMLFILVLILPSFVFFGIQGYNSYVDKDGALATVDGAPISQQEYDVALRDRIERLQPRPRRQFRSEAPGNSGSSSRRTRSVGA